jgi:hypothetical protein
MQTVSLEPAQWQTVLNLLGRARFNRVAPLYLAIQRQLVPSQPQPEATAAPAVVRSNGEDTAAEHPR